MLQQLKDDLDQISSEAVRAGLVEFVRYLLTTIPPERKRTRKACKMIYAVGELQGFAGAVFPSQERFPTSGTRTRQIISAAWRRKQLDVFNIIRTSFSEAVSDLKSTFHITVKG